jgi:hypothetical protein
MLLSSVHLFLRRGPLPALAVAFRPLTAARLENGRCNTVGSLEIDTGIRLRLGAVDATWLAGRSSERKPAFLTNQIIQIKFESNQVKSSQIKAFSNQIG